MTKDEVGDYEGKVVLVTGGAGCVGSNLCRKLAELNAKKVIILDNLSSAYEWNIPKADNVVFIKG
ncbi:MAG: NAD-dependent epimerase/dehydratase family protein, partial [ANME-2 cluster archaeon]|nr:NAD-dependent epimerase/dehydratase family protein [ANME-2 cluster archaeon]